MGAVLDGWQRQQRQQSFGNSGEKRNNMYENNELNENKSDEEADNVRETSNTRYRCCTMYKFKYNNNMYTI